MKIDNARRLRRRGVSEVIATLVTMTMTLVAGFAVWGYVNGQAGVNEKGYAQAVGTTVEYLEERFVVPQFAFSAGAVTIYVYNTGGINLQLVQVALYDSSKSVVNVVFSATGATDTIHSGCAVTTLSLVESPPLGTGSGSFSLSQGSVSTLTLTLPTHAMNSNCPTAPTWVSGTAYYAQVTALYGNQVVYYQVD
jgi:flagellin-like protein